MQCPRCDSDTLVFDSRSGNDDATNRRSAGLLKKGRDAWGWWDDEGFRLRKRRCKNPDCKHQMITIEVALDDLGNAFADARELCGAGATE